MSSTVADTPSHSAPEVALGLTSSPLIYVRLFRGPANIPDSNWLNESRRDVTRLSVYLRSASLKNPSGRLGIDFTFHTTSCIEHREHLIP